MRSLGWLKAPPDTRDWRRDNADKMTNMSKLKRAETLPARVDLREWCSPVEDQGRIGSCTAHAAMSIIEYYQRRAFGKHINGSRLFVYKATRTLMGVTGDTGAYLGDTMKAIRMLGVPPEQYWPYSDNRKRFDREPTPLVVGMAQNFKALQYYRHDTVGVKPETYLETVKQDLAVGIPCMCGFWYFGDNGLEFEEPSGRAQGGHAVAIVGYNEQNRTLLARNSWGHGWGEGGYGNLPYSYVLEGYADEFWSLTSMEWLDTDAFEYQ